MKVAAWGLSQPSTTGAGDGERRPGAVILLNMHMVKGMTCVFKTSEAAWDFIDKTIYVPYNTTCRTSRSDTLGCVQSHHPI